MCQKHPYPFQTKSHRFDDNPKLEMMTEMLQNILVEPTHKCIIWAYFKEELNLIEETLKKEEIGYIRVDGSNSDKGPKLSVAFQNDPNIRVWLGQISTGVALTLTAATYMIYYSVSYDLGHYLQSIDRNYRIGQRNSVTVYRLTCENSVLEFLYRALDQKENIAASLTEKILCILCTRGLLCMAQGIRPFSPNCIFPNKVSRLITKPKLLGERGTR
jgi:SNF2 family DNA or RNA helicase